jgi:ribonuclease PH
MERSGGRDALKMRSVKVERGVVKNADGSCLIDFGDTRVLCCASVEEGVPLWRRQSRAGWVTAEYAMLPASGGGRTKREYKGRKGRSQEIERLIGRSLRACVDLQRLGEFTVTVDCDVINADGGTRTASITGGWVALYDAISKANAAGKISGMPIVDQVAAISVGKVAGEVLVDLDYPEDSHAEVDCNIVANGALGLIEIQGTGERSSFSREELDAFLDGGLPAIGKLLELQRKVTNFGEPIRFTN